MGALSENSFHEARKLENLFLFTLYELKRRPGCRWPHLSGAPRGPIGWGASRGAAALTCGRSAECWFYPLRKGCLTIFIFLLNLEISDNAGRLGSGCQRPMWKSLSLRGRARERGRAGAREGGVTGCGGRRCERSPAASSMPGNRRELAWRKFWGRTGFPLVRCPSDPCLWGTGGPSGSGARHGAMLAAVPPAGLWGKEAEMLPGPACGSHYFEKLQLAWENGTGVAVGLP